MTVSPTFGERDILVGGIIGYIGYGASLVLFALTFSIMVSRRLKCAFDWLKLLYIVVLFSVGTAALGVNSRWFEIVFIDEANYPGGIYAFTEENTGKYKVTVAENSLYTVGIWLQDVFLLYRFSVIWNHNRWMVAIPSSTFLATLSQYFLKDGDVDG